VVVFEQGIEYQVRIIYLNGSSKLYSDYYTVVML
jgi:hypothetical protein